MEPSSHPWRVFDAPAGTAPPSSGNTIGGQARPASAAPPMPRRLLGAGIGALAVLVAAAVWLAAGSPTGLTQVEASGDPSATGSGTPGGIVVDVAGAVNRPGVYHLVAGSRVADALSAAGGFGPRVDASRAAETLNLAALVTDGDHILVPSRDDGAAGGGAGQVDGTSPPSGTLVDLNHATEAELEALPGIGQATAAKIIASRTERPFAAVGDLRERKLVGQKTFDGLRDLVTVR